MYAYVKGACPWLDEHIKSCVRQYVSDVIFVNHIVSIRPSAATVFQFCSGENLGRHFNVMNAAETALINAYPNSDALARKDCLARAVEYWTAKRPDSILKDHVPITVRLSLDYSEYVDDALAAADDLTLLYSLEDNENKAASEREWWILKPAILDCGAGIRIFSTVEELASNLELAANLEEEDDEQSEEVQEPNGKRVLDTERQGDDWRSGVSPSLSLPGLDSLDAMITTTGNLSVNGSRGKLHRDSAAQQCACEDSGRIPSAQMREFVAQRYIVSVPPLENRKWHIRSYALSVGRLKVHVYREMLALLALDDQKPPWDDPGAGSFLTNTAIQNEDQYVSKESMRDFWQTPDDLLTGDWKARTFDQICAISAEVFRAAAHTMSDKFTTLDKCFGLFALDFLVDTSGTVWLLEVNETPVFYEHGFAGALAQRLMESVICVAMEHMGNSRLEDSQNSAVRVRMVEVLDETEKLGKSSITEIVPQV
ncbi:hypothetical protein DL764_008831 [Monosporascus ibericus]|uniref:ATP-grasp domain-containing protein n=1 Tax=Monosporascus ibericus TaxID=155417 RepID=A0A4Q4SWL0_9PEZI|nr:hypothetical protein DL764_008831 [Monosporascus ibericus]